MIEFTIENVDVPGLDPEFFVLWLNTVIKDEGFVCGEIAIVFCDDEYLLEMNNRFLKHDFYTDIITFDYSDAAVISGDLFISIDRIIENAASLNVLYFTELQRVCVHGVLHLLGYKDKTNSDIKEMRNKEEFYLNKYVSRETLL